MAGKGKVARAAPAKDIIHAAIPPMPREQWIRLRCLEIAVTNSSKVGVLNPFNVAVQYANYVLTGKQDIA